MVAWVTLAVMVPAAQVLLPTPTHVTASLDILGSIVKKMSMNARLVHVSLELVLMVSMVIHVDVTLDLLETIVISTSMTVSQGWY